MLQPPLITAGNRTKWILITEIGKAINPGPQCFSDVTDRKPRGAREGEKKTPCSIWAEVMLAAVCEISSPFGSCVDETATRADVYNHVLNKYWMEYNKKEREKGARREGENETRRNLFILFSNTKVSLAAVPPFSGCLRWSEWHGHKKPFCVRCRCLGFVCGNLWRCIL